MRAGAHGMFILALAFLDVFALAAGWLQLLVQATVRQAHRPLALPLRTHCRINADVATLAGDGAPLELRRSVDVRVR